MTSANSSFEPPSRALSLLYRAAQRIFVCDVSRLMMLDRSRLQARQVEPQFAFRLLEADDVERLAEDSVNELTIKLAERMQAGRDLCLAAFAHERLAAYVWLAIGSIEAEHNRGRTRRSGVAVSFPPDTALVYKAFTNPDFRGQGLYPALLERSLGMLEGRGVSRLVTTADWTNGAALHVCRQLGFQILGTILRCACGPLTITLKPPRARQLEIRLGRAARVDRRTTYKLRAEPETGDTSPELLLSGAAGAG